MNILEIKAQILLLKEKIENEDQKVQELYWQVTDLQDQMKHHVSQIALYQKQLARLEKATYKM